MSAVWHWLATYTRHVEVIGAECRRWGLLLYWFGVASTYSWVLDHELLERCMSHFALIVSLRPTRCSSYIVRETPLNLNPEPLNS